jgi:beta-N-acetylhexosaminidase
MSLDRRVGQLLMVGVPATDPESGTSLVRSGVGNIFLQGHSSASVEAIRGAVTQLQAAARATTGIGVQVSVDQEGGLVQSLRGPGFASIPSAVDQGQLSISTLREQTATWAGELTRAGITLDLAPVADTVPPGTSAENPPIGVFGREYGSDSTSTASRVSTVVAAMRSQGLSATVKHFPGLGRVRANTDTSTAASDPVTTADDPYLRPFQAGIQAGAAVMVSSAHYPQLDSDHVAAFSSAIIGGLLRNRWGYDGMVVSDDLGAAVAVSAVPAGQRAVDFVAAGGDVVLTVQPADVAPMLADLRARAAADAQFRARVDDAVRHVLLSKYHSGLLRCG